MAKIVARFAQDLHAIPDFCVDQQPQPVAVIGAARGMFIDKACDDGAVENAIAHKLRVPQTGAIQVCILRLQQIRQSG